MCKPPCCSVDQFGDPFPVERCRQWAADCREIAESIAVIIARCTPGGRNRERVERLLREALNEFTRSVHALTMVRYGEWELLGDA